MADSAPRTSPALLLVIVLAVFVQPFLLAMIFAGKEEAAPATVQPKLAEAIEKLTAELRRERRGEPAPFSADSVPAEASPDRGPVLERLAAALERLAPSGASGGAAASPVVLGPMTRGGGIDLNALPHGEDQMARIGVVVQEELDRRARREAVPTTRFFLMGEQEVLARFGVPTSVNAGGGYSSWYYKRADGRGFLLTMQNGRVSRFYSQ